MNTKKQLVTGANPIYQTIGWAIRKIGQKKPTLVTKTRQEAIAMARCLSKDAYRELVIVRQLQEMKLAM